MEFKSPVQAKVIKRDDKTAKGIQGYYKIDDKTLYLFDDIKGSYERGVLIHEMVHALQDQHFNLKKLHQQQFGSDSELALAALIEGDATYTMIEVLRKDQPARGRHARCTSGKERQSPECVSLCAGARYVKALKDKGGWKAVNSAIVFHRKPPRKSCTPGSASAPSTWGPAKTLASLA